MVYGIFQTWLWAHVHNAWGVQICYLRKKVEGVDDVYIHIHEFCKAWSIIWCHSCWTAEHNRPVIVRRKTRSCNSDKETTIQMENPMSGPERVNHILSTTAIIQLNLGAQMAVVFDTTVRYYPYDYPHPTPPHSYVYVRYFISCTLYFNHVHTHNFVFRNGLNSPI